MNDPKGHLCPECGTPRAADNTPSCGCTRRASDALRDARTAEAAAAEDFDPLRIRPYVELKPNDGGTSAEPDGTVPGGRPVRPDASSPASTDPTMPNDPDVTTDPDATTAIPRVDTDSARREPWPTVRGHHTPTAPGPDRPDPDATVALPAVEPTSARPGIDAVSARPTGDATAALPTMDATAAPHAARATDATALLPTDAATAPPATDPAKAPGTAADPPGAADATALLPAVGTAPAAPSAPAVSAADATAPLPVADGTATPPAAGASRTPPDATFGTAAAPPADVTSVLPPPLAPSATTPSVNDLRIFAGDRAKGGTGDEAGTVGYLPVEGDRPARRRRRTALLAAGGAVVAVVAAAGLASGLFSYETPAREGAPPEDVRAAVPDTSTSAASAPPETESASAPTTSAAPPPPSASPSLSSSASASASSAAPSAPASSPAGSPTSTDDGGAEAGTEPTEGSGNDEQGAPVLRRGDSGPEVTELQERLHQRYLYNGEVDGDFSTQVENALSTYQFSRGVGTDNPGVYDQETRAALEKETSEP
ncbi:peptidoglycan-binding protein [Streptomyces sp. NPDC005263]|uniref:peptidoglycan-binding domain-containing protein n=1 Tax=Streptomyces sp. NPDC005263 TaxID=3364711 RepID=UPI0036A1180A